MSVEKETSYYCEDCNRMVSEEEWNVVETAFYTEVSHKKCGNIVMTQGLRPSNVEFMKKKSDPDSKIRISKISVADIICAIKYVENWKIMNVMEEENFKKYLEQHEVDNSAVNKKLNKEYHLYHYRFLKKLFDYLDNDESRVEAINLLNNEINNEHWLYKYRVDELKGRIKVLDLYKDKEALDKVMRDYAVEYESLFSGK